MAYTPATHDALCLCETSTEEPVTTFTQDELDLWN